jgi:26S proteasome regulatory subunit N2
LLELKSSKKGSGTTTNSEAPGKTRQSEQERSRRDGIAAETGGAEAAIGVLTAVDEDEEGGEEAEVPRDFYYESDEDAYQE